METKKICKSCGRELPITKFKNGRWGYVGVCIDCDTEHRRAKRQERLEKEAEEIAKATQEKRVLRLQDFTPRELMEELARRGYTGKLEYIETHVVDITNI